MKAKALQFGKAMSAALFVLLLSVAGMKNAFAQQTLVATLQHGEDISVFYGNNAFVSAHNAAVDGDIVTLSSGSFIVPSTITKAITLRGAGVVSDSLAGTAPTIFAQQVVINVSNDSIPFQVEGILFSNEMQYITMYNPKFTRCSFNKIAYGSYNMNNAQFVNCMIKDFDFSRANNTTLINSVVWNPTYISDSHTVLLYNSIMRIYNTYSSIGGLSAFNSIFIRDNNNNSNAYNPSSTCTFFNCIGIRTGQYTPFGNAYVSDCTTYSSYGAVFESFTGNFSLKEPFILKEEIANSFLGNDGTQVGIHGGLVPYSNRPYYMVVKRCNVANKSTIDGKLSVEIEVVTEEE
jgi:hypothetical protein